MKSCRQLLFAKKRVQLVAMMMRLTCVCYYIYMSPKRINVSEHAIHAHGRRVVHESLDK